MNNDEKYIKLAIEEAKKSVEAGGAPIGAVLVKEDEVISTGWSLVWPKKDPVDYHAESHAKSIQLASGNKLEVVGGVLREECAELMKNIENWTPKENA